MDPAGSNAMDDGLGVWGVGLDAFTGLDNRAQPCFNLTFHWLGFFAEFPARRVLEEGERDDAQSMYMYFIRQ